MQTTISAQRNIAGAYDDGVSLDSKIQSLAQELQDMIFYFYEGSQLQESVDIAPESYKPPVALQLDRKSRSRFAAAYYHLAVFKIDHEAFGMNGRLPEKYDCESWIESLSDEHTTMISTIGFTIGTHSTRIYQTCQRSRVLFARLLRREVDYKMFGNKLRHARVLLSSKVRGERGKLSDIKSENEVLSVGKTSVDHSDHWVWFNQVS